MYKQIGVLLAAAPAPESAVHPQHGVSQGWGFPCALFPQHPLGVSCAEPSAAAARQKPEMRELQAGNCRDLDIMCCPAEKQHSSHSAASSIPSERIGHCLTVLSLPYLKLSSTLGRDPPILPTRVWGKGTVLHGCMWFIFIHMLTASGLLFVLPVSTYTTCFPLWRKED